MRRSRPTSQPNSKSATGPYKVRLSKFFSDLANNTPNDSQFKTKKRVNTKKKKKKLKNVITEEQWVRQMMKNR